MASARRVRAAEVAVGDCMLVKPGEQVGRMPVVVAFWQCMPPFVLAPGLPLALPVEL